MVEMPRPFDRAQGILQPKRSSVMPAHAGIQADANAQNLDFHFRGNDGKEQVDFISPLREQFLDLHSNPSVFWFHCAFERGYRLARLVEEKLVEIPLRRLLRLR